MRLERHRYRHQHYFSRNKGIAYIPLVSPLNSDGYAHIGLADLLRHDFSDVIRGCCTQAPQPFSVLDRIILLNIVGEQR